jgi:hypothetical protein
MKRAITASCFAFACLPHLAHAGDADDETSSALPPLPAPAARAQPPPPGPADTPPSATEPAASGGASSEPPPADAQVDAPSRFPRLAWSVDGGYAHQALYGVPINSASLSLVVGANFRQLLVGGFVDGSYGSTVDALRTLTGTSGPLVEGHFGVLRLGAGVRFGLLAINRATATDSMTSASLGAMARATVDLLGTDSSQGLFLVGRATVDCVGTPTTPLYGVMLGVGIRSIRF